MAALVCMFASTLSAQPVSDAFLEKILRKNPEWFGKILENPSAHGVQIMYTKIDRNRRNEPHFTTYRYNIDKDKYFYPASTVKLPAVLLAFEKINQLSIAGLDKDTPMFTEATRPEQTAVTTDTTAENGLPSVSHYAKKVLLVSDNDAFNRLYEFIGQEEFNEKLREKGYLNTRIRHRLQLPMSTENNRYTNPLRFEKNGKVIYQQPAAYAEKVEKPAAPILLGKGYMKDGNLVNEPFDFTEKNAFALEDQHKLLKAIFFSETLEPTERFDLKPDDYQFLYRYMSQLPMETSYPEHYSEDFYDSYVKFFIFGNNKKRMPRHIRVFNKVGDAYGYLLDNAYIVDFERGIEFMLTAVIDCNENQIYNDDTYAYESVGFPFMAHLGEAIFEYEMNRKKRGRPDLSRFEVEYDK
ncbi:serine hydrolase [Persicitalea sp.]|uniref:serine hydrolase n=1 Tax=Persicitalea sp. TaxID=3100273 RepID=UPI003593EBDB